MKNLLIRLAVTIALVAVPTPAPAFGCGPAIFMGGTVEGNCVIRHYQKFCDGVLVSYDTVECF